MESLEEWRKGQLPTIKPLGTPATGVLSRLFLRNARCGHESPKSAAILMGTRKVGLSLGDSKEICPSCLADKLREEIQKIISAAVPCAKCGSPIVADSPIGACVSIGGEVEFPAVKTEEGFLVLCDGCMMEAACIYGYWDGQKAVRLKADELAIFGIIYIQYPA